MNWKRSLAIGGLVALCALGGCDEKKTNSKDFKLPNGAKVKLDYLVTVYTSDTGKREVADFNPTEGQEEKIYIVRDLNSSLDTELINGARIIGKVNYIGFAKTPEGSPKNLAINQNTADHWGEDNTGNNYANVSSSRGDVVINVSCEGTKYSERVLVIPSKDNLNPASLLEIIKTGDKISFPTIRENQENKGKNYAEFKLIDNQVESYSTQEIIKVN